MKKIMSFLILVISTHALAMLPLARSTCQKQYLSLFSNDEINMTVAFGYDDLSEDTSNDQKSLEIFVKTLPTKCVKWDQRLCGFSLKSKAPHVLIKKIFGPDGKPKTLKVTTDASIVSPNNKANGINPLQKLQSQSGQNLFLSGLENSEITIYMGHSRDGGGPSFSPPKLDSHGHVNYDYYHKHKRDKKLMIQSLAKTANKSRIVASISCSSIRWFARSIEYEAASSGIIGTTESFTTGNFKETWPLIERIFSYQCLKDLGLQDLTNGSQIVQNKGWKVPKKDQELSQSELDAQTLENLAAN